MKRLVLIALAAVLALTCCPAAAFAQGENQMSSETLDIASHLSDYSEEELRAQLAEPAQGRALLAENGASGFSVCVADNASDSVSEAANALCEYLCKIIGSDDTFPVVRESELRGEPFISLGNTRLSADCDTSALEDDGYLVSVFDGAVYLKTLDDSDISNAVYGFLEDELGCMFAREDYDYIPSLPTIYLDGGQRVSNPDFSWRKVFQYEAAQNSWFKKLRLNGVVADDIEKNAGWGTWCHSCFQFVDPEIYGASHPEYFTYNEAGEPQQLCLTNPDVYPIIEAEMAKKIAAEPDKKYWDFSLNDNYNYCTCENCARVLEETGSMMGTMLPIINSLAEKFPDKVISTLAYFYNEEVPKGMVCEENVNIVLCPINTGQLYSYRFGASEKAAKTKQLVESWSAVCQSLMIWDYVVDFQHLLLPYPNFDVQKDNHAFYIENNVKEIFHQGSREKNDEMARLRTYVLSKQLWDNELDVSALIAKYLTVTYGAAAPYIAEYMDGMNARLKEKGEDLDLYDEAWQHAGDYLSKADNDRYLELVNSALSAVEGDERLTYYVEEIKINVLYAIMNEATNLYHFRKKDAFSEFTALVQKHDIEQPHEVGVTMQEYIDTEYPAFLTENALKITACVVSAVAAAGIAAGIAVIIKKKKAKKQQG